MITLHYLKDSRALRVLWLLEELNLEYTIKTYPRDPKTLLAPDSLKQIHPLGKSPVITDGDKVVAESAVIIEYLAETYGGKEGRIRLIPSDPQAFQDYRYWMHYAEGSFMPYLVMRLVFDTVKTSPMPFFVRPIVKQVADRVIKAYIRPNINTHLEFLNEHLSKHEYFAGSELSGADIQMSFPLQAVVERASNVDKFQKVVDYMNRISRRSAYQTAKTKADAL